MPSHEDWRWFVLEILDEEHAVSWDDAFAWVDDDDAWELEQAIAELQLEGRVQFSLQSRGYVLDDRPPVG